MSSKNVESLLNQTLYPKRMQKQSLHLKKIKKGTTNFTCH